MENYLPSFFSGKAPPAASRLVRTMMRASELVLFRGVGHYLNLATPDAFNIEIRRFLSAQSVVGGQVTARALEDGRGR
jgi:pimeloyl-ACP methyl ester carboxylesterase